jgi:hypothetical protein
MALQGVLCHGKNRVPTRLVRPARFSPYAYAIGHH